MKALSSFEVALDLLIVSKSVHIFEKDIQVLFYLLRSLGAHMFGYLRGHLPRIKVKCLHHLLVVSPVPVCKTFFEQKVLFNLVLVSKVHVLHACEVTAVFAVYLLLNQLLEPVRIREESEVLDDLKLFTFGFITDSDVATLEDLRTESALT